MGKDSEKLNQRPCKQEEEIRRKKKPDFIGLADWNMMLETWQEERHQKRSKTNSQNASSNPDGLGTHRHTSGSKNHKRYAYDLVSKFLYSISLFSAILT